jgi:hypothetical protein
MTAAGVALRMRHFLWRRRQAVQSGDHGSRSIAGAGSGTSIPGIPLRSELFTLKRRAMRHDEGYAFRCSLPPEIPAGDDETTLLRSVICLFENGVALGPSRAKHERIRGIGKGRFSHWRNTIYFSASDNSSPLFNLRRYHVLVPGAMRDPEGSSLALWEAITATGAEAELSTLQRFVLARRSYWGMWPHGRLPDIGRRIDTDQDFAGEFARVSPEADFSYERKYNLNELFQLALRVEGDVVECGVYKGGSAFFLGRHIQRHHSPRRLCLFDSFQGLSPPTATDGDWWRRGDLRGSIKDVEDAMAPLGDLSFVEIYPGWIPQRFGEVAERRFCFVHIDVDLFAPTVDSIRFFYPRVNRGGIILLDDYGHQSCVGATAAIDQFMIDKPEPIVNLASGGALIVKE